MPTDMFILLMGVTASGKTTVGSLLASSLGWRFYDGDDFHPRSNVTKMSSGIPLTDEDRTPWLAKLGEIVARHSEAGESGVLACSALKQKYRDVLSSAGDVVTAYLKAEPELVRQRLGTRRGHYMLAALVESQFLALEEPEVAITVPASWPPERIVRTIRLKLGI
jgi:gluconokinase